MSRQQPSSTQQDLHAATRAPWTRFLIIVVVLYIGTVIAGGLALLYSPSARAELSLGNLGARLEMLGGQCKQGKIANGIWFQEQYPHNLDFSSHCAHVGFSFLTESHGPWSFGWRFAYVDLGTMRFDSVFTMRDDEYLLVYDGANCNPSTMSGCLGHGRGDQRARGVSAGYLTERTVGPFILGAETGLFLYDGRFHVAIDDKGASSNVGPMQFNWRGYQLTPYVGTTARYGYLLLMAQIYGRVRAAENGCGGCSGFANGPAMKLSAGVSIPF